MRNVQLWVYGVDRGLGLLDQAPPGQGVCWGEGGRSCLEYSRRAAAVHQYVRITS